MTDNIVKRLREIEAGYSMRSVLTEAADEIERLRAERDKLKNELLECEDILDEYRRSDADRSRWENAND